MLTKNFNICQKAKKLNFKIIIHNFFKDFHREYIDIKRSKLGVSIGNDKVSILAYADDTVLLADPRRSYNGNLIYCMSGMVNGRWK